MTENSPAVPTTTEQKSAPSDAAKIVRRSAYEAIEAAYDQRLKCYSFKVTGRASDDSIARTIGCSEQLVAQIREEFFGPAEPHEPTEDITNLKRSMAEFERETQNFQALANGLRKKAVDLNKELQSLNNRLADMCAAHGWGH